jgi:hypothetical protein
MEKSSRKPYPSDVTDEWEFVAPYLMLSGPTVMGLVSGRPSMW